MAHKLRLEGKDREKGGQATSYKHTVQLRLPDDLIEDLSGRLASDWYKLGIELSIDTKIIDKLYNRGRVRADRWPLRLLQEWRKQRHHMALREQVMELAHALEKIHRGDLVAVLRCATEEHQHKGLSDRLLLQLAEGVNQDWYTLGLHLDFTPDTLDSIKMEEVPDPRLDPGGDLLRVYRDQYCGVDMVQELQQALRGIRRLDLSRHVDETLSYLEDEAQQHVHCGQSEPKESSGDEDLLPRQGKDTSYTSTPSQSSILSTQSHIVPSSVDTSLLVGQSRTSTIVTSGSTYTTEKK